MNPVVLALQARYLTGLERQAAYSSMRDDESDVAALQRKFCEVNRIHLEGEAAPVATAPKPARDQRITLLWQGKVDGTVEGFEVNGMLVIPDQEGVTYVCRQDAIAFFGLVEPSIPQAVVIVQGEV